MDEYYGKRSVNEFLVPRRGLRDIAVNMDDNVRLSRLGCNTRVGSTERPKTYRYTLNSSNGRAIVGSSSRTLSAMLRARRPLKESHRKSDSHIENDLSDSTLHGEPEVSEYMQSSTENQHLFSSATGDSGSSKGTLTEVDCSSGPSSSTCSKPRKILCHISSSSNQTSPVDSSVSSLSKDIGTGTRKSCSGAEYRSRNLNCNSVSDVLPQSCSPSDFRFSRRDMMKRINSEAESSSSYKGKKISEASPEEGHVIRPTHGISISDSRSSRNSYFSENNHVVSVRTHRSINVNTSFKGSDSLQSESSGLNQNLPRPEASNPSLQPSSQFFTDVSSSNSSAYGFPGNDVDDLPGVVPYTSAELDINQLMNRNALQQYTMDGIAQFLVALERIEHDEELMYELLVLETSLLLGGLNFYDQHRGMRLDVDNMSYEELLALEERMGTVSTALPEEALSKCLQRSIYQAMPSEIGACEGGGNEDENKCSICQEEYTIGDEIGLLECEHWYHMECIKHWLRLKNWCPICKASAALSHPSTTPL